MFARLTLDALAMVLMFHQAFHLTQDKSYLEKLYISFNISSLENDLRMNLYDFETRVAAMDWRKLGINRNQGAESTLAYLISHLTVLQAFENSIKRNTVINESGHSFAHCLANAAAAL